MLIDWVTLIAQVVNFLVLVWLLKRFLYRPILAAIDVREKNIVEQLVAAEDQKAQSILLRDGLQKKNDEFDNFSAVRMKEMTDKILIERNEKLAFVKVEAEKLRKKLYLSIKSEQHSLQESISLRVRDEVFNVARKVLCDLAETTLETAMTTIFIRRLNDLEKSDLLELKKALKKSLEPLLVRTAFTLSKEQRQLIKSVIHKTLNLECTIEFEADPRLISGFELCRNGQKISWNIADYLDTLVVHVNELLDVPNKNE